MKTNVKNIVSRITIFYLIVVLLSLYIVWTVFRLQFFTDLKTKAKEIAVKQETIEASRGNIFGYDDRMLATSLPYYEVRMDFAANGIADSTFNKNVAALAKSLAGLFKDKNASDYEKVLRKNRKDKSKHRYERIGNRNVNFIELQQIKSFPILKLGQNKGGIIVIEKTKRHNPYGTLAFRTIGWVNSNDSAAVGIEGSFNKYLQGKKGSQVVQRIAGNQWMPVNSEYDVQPETGDDVITTLDIDIQDAAENALRKQLQKQNTIEGGTAIVMEVASGEIRAIANMKRNADGTYSESYNYAIGETSPPGSTFKLATLIALLDETDATLNEIVETQPLWVYNKHKFREAGGHNYGTIPIKRVFEKSSNVGFAKLAVKYFAKNPQKYFDKLKSMGLFQKSLKLQITGENSPHVTEPSNKRWNPQLLPLSAIGYEVTLAPIHTATLYNAVANNGKMMRPKFVKAVVKHGQIIKEFPDEVMVDSICSYKTILDVRSALEGVVDSGTARHIRDLRYKFAGKTGTAQRVVNGRFHDAQGRTAYQATFAAYFPAENPQYTIVVVLYSPPMLGNFYGGTWAAPVFKEIADKIYSKETKWYKPIERTEKYASFPNAKSTQTQSALDIAKALKIPANDMSEDSEWVKISSDSSKIYAKPITISENKMPQVVNMGLKDALYLLESLDLNVTFSGKGSVKRQSIEAGAAITKGQNVYLELEN